MPYIKSLTEPDLCQLILQTKKELFLVMPLIHPKLMDALNELDSLNVDISINLGFDFSPENFRQGYGEMEAFDQIVQSKFNCLNMKDNRISFIIKDDTGYFLFIESRYLIPAEKATINAVKIDPISIVRLKHHFFKPFERKALENQLANAIIDESIRFKDVEQEFKLPGIIETKEIDAKMVDAVNDNLKKNPPLKPDYKRIVEYYSTKFQYVKLIFKGANLQSKKIELPKKALTVNDVSLRKRLETKLNLFNTVDENELFPELDDIKLQIKELREYYLVPLKIRQENLLEIAKKEDFETEVEQLKVEIAKISDKIIQKIEAKMEETREILQKELLVFYTENPKQISDNDLFLNSDEAYKKKVAKKKAEEIVHSIKWPEAFELLSKMSMQLFYSNITKEDLSNKDLLNELVDRKVITEADKTSLADFGKGIEINNV